MDVTVNGERRSLRAGTSVAGLLEGLGLDVARVVVEHNREIVPREEFAAVQMVAGDTVEIVHFVGGG
jgi:thiamine biosynthesis protein ThiS